MTYIITAIRIDNNGATIASNNAETLGEAYGATYASMHEAKNVAASLDAEKAELEMADAIYSVEEA